MAIPIYEELHGSSRICRRTLVTFEELLISIGELRTDLHADQSKEHCHMLEKIEGCDDSKINISEEIEDCDSLGEEIDTLHYDYSSRKRQREEAFVSFFEDLGQRQTENEVFPLSYYFHFEAGIKEPPLPGYNILEDISPDNSFTAEDEEDCLLSQVQNYCEPDTGEHYTSPEEGEIEPCNNYITEAESLVEENTELRRSFLDCIFFSLLDTIELSYIHRPPILFSLFFPIPTCKHSLVFGFDCDTCQHFGICIFCDKRMVGKELSCNSSSSVKSQAIERKKKNFSRKKELSATPHLKYLQGINSPTVDICIQEILCLLILLLWATARQSKPEPSQNKLPLTSLVY